MATYQEQTGGTLPFYNEAYQRLIQDAEARAKQQMGMTPPPQTVAGFTPMQEEAFKLAGSSVGQYQPWLEQAQQFATQAGQGAQFDPSQVQQYLSPYLSGVVGEIGRLGQEQFQQQVIPGITGAMGGLGQFGSARQAAMLADASGRSQREILGQQANALNTGYNQAMGAYGDWTKMGIGAQQQAAQQLGNLAQAGQGMTTQDIAQLTTAGKTQQDLAQQQANLPFTNWMTQQQYPWQVQNQWANLFKTAPTSQTSWNTGFKKGGLARYADGGRFSWQVSPEDQREKDEQRVDLLLAELEQNPDDPALIEELKYAGVDTSLLPRRDTIDTPSVAIDKPPASIPMSGPTPNASSLEDLARQSYDERMNLLRRAQTMPELQGKPEPHWAESVGEAMLRSAAQGPTNIGQLVGRAGEAYFDAEKAREVEGRNLALKRLALEESVLPDVSTGRSGALGRGSTPTPEQLRTVYTGARNEAAQVAKDMDFPGGAPERMAWIEQEANKAVDNYVQRFAIHPTGPRGTASMPPPTVTPAAAPPATTAPIEPPAAPPATAPAAPPAATGQIVPTPRDRAKEAQKKTFSVESEKAAKEDYSTNILPAARIGESTRNMISALKQIPRTQDRFAPWRQELGSWMGAMGFDGKMVEQAENLQQVRPLLARIANERLLLAKGTQTEGDAERAYNEFIKIGDTEKAVEFMLSWSEELANRDIFKKQLYEAGAKEENTWTAGSGMWDQSDYAQTAPVAIIDGDVWNFTEFREQAAKNNPNATITQIMDEWNKLVRSK